MYKVYVSFFFLLSTATILNAQNKRELQAEIEVLKDTLSATQWALSESRSRENVSLARAESFETQLEGLKITNAQLYKSMSTFMEASTQKTDNIGVALETLRQKEAKLKTINEILKANDSTALMVLTDFKKTLGEEASITVVNGSVTIKMEKVQLFGANATNSKLETDATPLLKKLASVLKTHGSMLISVEGNAPLGTSLDMATRRATALVEVLTNTHQIVPERISANAKFGTGDALFIKIHPNFDAFYLMVRSDMKQK